MHRSPPGPLRLDSPPRSTPPSRPSRTDHPEWIDAYRADRPIVERKIAHFARRIWGGRNARCRGLDRISTDVDTRAAAVNLARLATLGVTFNTAGWTLNTS